MTDEVGQAWRAEVGSFVEVELVEKSGAAEKLTFTLVEDSQADFSAGFLGRGTPLARAILGRKAGETLPYLLGDLVQVRILAVQPKGQVQTENVTARRQATLRRAVSHSDYVNALIFAGSVNSKWGEYDIGKLDSAQWQDQADADAPPSQEAKNHPD
jgi:hypothetical protein